MAATVIIDSLFPLAKSSRVTQMYDCVPFTQDLTPKMQSDGIAGVVIAPCNNAQCQHMWNCADRRTHEVASVVAKHPKQLRGLSCYDPLQIGESLRWIDDAVTEGELAGAYVQTENCDAGLDASRMYPLYGLCAKLRCPVVIDFSSRERWALHRSQVEVVAADFPELDVLLATPPRTESENIRRFLQRFPRVSFLLCPQELQLDQALCDYMELHGREHALFRAAPMDWAAAVETAQALPLSTAAQRAYCCENASRLFKFPVEVSA